MIYEKIPTQFNISEYLINQGLEDKVALYYLDEVYTYKDLKNRINQYANYLVDSGMEKSSTMAIYMRDCPELIYLSLGAIKAGILPIVVNPKMTASQLKDIVKRTRANIVFTDDELIENIKQEELTEIAKSYKEICSNAEEKSTEFQTVDSKKDDAALVLFTSGSSGIPKGVVHRHFDFVAAVEGFGKDVLKAEASDIFYTHSKMSFAFGLGGLYIPLAVGASLIVNGDDDLYNIIDIVEKYHVTKFQAVSSVYLSLSMLLEEGKQPFSSCKICIASGEPLTKKTAQDWKDKTGIEIYQGYGSTEMLTVVISNNEGETRYGSMGKAVAGVSTSIINDVGEIAKPNEIGTLFIKGETMMEKYWDDDETTNEVITKNGFMTGDMCYSDEDGFIWYAGRNSDVFKINGIWQSALPIEEVMLEDENVVEAIVTNQVYETESCVVAYVVAKNLDKCEESIKNIRTLFFKKKMRLLCPKKFYFVEAIPRGNTGKIKRGAVNTAKILKEME